MSSTPVRAPVEFTPWYPFAQIPSVRALACPKCRKVWALSLLALAFSFATVLAVAYYTHMRFDALEQEERRLMETRLFLRDEQLRILGAKQHELNLMKAYRRMLETDAVRSQDLRLKTKGLNPNKPR